MVSTPSFPIHHPFRTYPPGLSVFLVGIYTNTQTNLSLYTVSALLILDSDGARVLAKYYTPPHQATIGTGLVADLGVGAGGPGMGLGGLKEQKAFEKSIWEKVKRGGGESFHSCR